MIWILILAVIVWLLFKFVKEHNEHIQTHVTNYGGMDEKYSVLIEFLQGAGMHITKLGASSIELKNKAESANCVMYYIGTHLEILFITNMPLLGYQKKKWVFPDGYPQEKMIEEIDNYANWQVQQMMKVSDNSQYINYDERD